MRKKINNTILTEQELKDYVNNLHENTNSLRKNAGEKWDIFQKYTGVCQSVVTEWKTKNRMPRLDNLVSIANHFNVSIEWLIGKTQKEKKKPSLLTYGEWIDFIETSIDYGIIDELYYPSLDHSTLNNKEQERITQEFLKQIMPNAINVDSVNEESDSCSDSGATLGVIHQYEQRDIYKVSKDMNGRFPDVLKIKDTFLRCLLAYLSYHFAQDPKEDYDLFRERIIEEYGRKIILNFDVYEMATINSDEYKKKLNGHCEISSAIFGKYDGIADIDLKALKKIWDDLSFWEKEYSSGKIKTRAEVKKEFWKNQNNNQ